MVFIAIANGVVRQAWYGRYLSELAGPSALQPHRCGAFRSLYLVQPAPGPGRQLPSQALAIGFLWLGLTVAFEFSFGHFVAGHSWSRLFQDYNLFAGRLWVLVLLWLTLAPYLFY